MMTLIKMIAENCGTDEKGALQTLINCGYGTDPDYHNQAVYLIGTVPDGINRAEVYELPGYGYHVSSQSAETFFEDLPADFSPKDGIKIGDINSAGIEAECEKMEITHIELLAEGHSDGNQDNPNSRVRFYQVGCVRVADTNGDPIWEEADEAIFADLIVACEVDL